MLKNRHGMLQYIHDKFVGSSRAIVCSYRDDDDAGLTKMKNRLKVVCIVMSMKVKDA